MSRRRIITGTVATLLFVASLINASDKIGGITTPMNAVQTYQDKRCVRCHLIDVSWDAYGPDLARSSLSGNFSDVVGRMWNKAPVMLNKMNELGIEFPNLDSEDLIRVASFVAVYQNLLGDYVENADIEHGGTLFHRNKCSSCHNGKRMQGAYSAPLTALEALWKHAWSVSVKGGQSHVTWERLNEDDARDLLAFLSDKGSRSGESAPLSYLAPGDYQRGKQSFTDLQCGSCHKSDGSIKRKSGNSSSNGSVTRLELRSLMAAFWNHSPKVWRISGKSNRKPAFNAQTLADLVAYWYAVRFERCKDDAVLGKALFAKKSCVTCHRVGSEAFTIPEEKDEILARMWSHVPEMVEACEDRGIQWPILQPGEISAIAEYLAQNRRSNSP